MEHISHHHHNMKSLCETPSFNGFPLWIYLSQSPEGYGSGASGSIHLAAKGLGVEKTTNDFSLSPSTVAVIFWVAKSLS